MIGAMLVCVGRPSNSAFAMRRVGFKQSNGT